MHPISSRYPLRVDVAKPAVVYQPSFRKEKDTTKPLASKSSENLSSVGSYSHCILGKRRRSGRTEFLVKRSGSAEPVWESSKAVNILAVQTFEDTWQSRQQLEYQLGAAKHMMQPGGSDSSISDRNPYPYRILAQRQLEGGQCFLIHWAGQSVADASWESAKCINNPALVHDFEQAVPPPSHPPLKLILRYLPCLSCNCSARHRRSSPPVDGVFLTTLTAQTPSSACTGEARPLFVRGSAAWGRALWCHGPHWPRLHQRACLPRPLFAQCRRLRAPAFGAQYLYGRRRCRRRYSL